MALLNNAKIFICFERFRSLCQLQLCQNTNQSLICDKLVDPGFYVKADSMYAIFGRFVLVFK